MEQKPCKTCLPPTGRRTSRLRGTAVLLLALLCLLPGCGKKGDSEETVELPTEYAFGDATITALATEEEGVQFAQAKTVTYLYDGLSESGPTVSTYTSQLVSDGFTVVDEDLVKTDKPDFTTEEGSVRLAKDIVPEETEEETESEDSEETEEDADSEDSGEEDEAGQAETESGQDAEEEEEETGMVTLIVLSWSEGACSVTIDEQEGKVIIPVTETASSSHSMSLTQAVDYLAQQSPASLGLSGSSMDEYHIYAQEGSVMVEDYVCVRLNVYSTNNAAGTNQFEGSFLMTGDGKHLFRTNAMEGTVEEVDLS